MEHFTLGIVPHPNAHHVNEASWDPRLGTDNERYTITKDFKEVQVGSVYHQVTYMGTSLSE